MVIGTDYIGSCKSNCHTISTMITLLITYNLFSSWYNFHTFKNWGHFVVVLLTCDDHFNTFCMKRHCTVALQNVLVLTLLTCILKNAFSIILNFSLLNAIMSPPTLVGRHIVFVLSVCPSHSLSAQLLCYAPLNLEISQNLLLMQFVSATPVKLLNRISWNFVGSKDTICSCAY